MSNSAATSSDSERPLECILRYEEEGQVRRVGVDLAEFSLGRSPECTLQLSHESVSRVHARIVAVNGSWTIEDLGSKNGVKLNTYRVSHEPLHNGDRIDLGAVRFYVEIAPCPETTHANVVFEKADKRDRHTEVIDIKRLDSLLATSLPSQVADPVTAFPNDALAPADRRTAARPADLLRLFTSAAEALISSESLDETLEHILALVFDNLPAERGVICLYNESSGETEPKVMRTRDGNLSEPIRISSNIARDVIERKQSLLVNDAAMDERYGGADSVISMRIQSAMCAPLYHEGHVAGFIYVDRQNGPDPFTATQLKTLSALALLSAVAVERTALRDDVRRERDIRTRLARYSSPAVVDRIVKQEDESTVGMVAHESDITVLFADLSGFTSMSETLQPSEVVQMLNQMFERLTEVIFDLGGTLDKFRGDGLMAFFGAPLPMDDHAERAVEAALQMQERLSELNAFSPKRRPLAIRIGINTGTLIVGDVGSPQRKDYTVIGDVANTASRLESGVAQPGQVVIGAETYRRVRSRFACRALESTRLKGKRKPVQPYLVTDRAGV